MGGVNFAPQNDVSTFLKDSETLILGGELYVIVAFFFLTAFQPMLVIPHLEACYLPLPRSSLPIMYVLRYLLTSLTAQKTYRGSLTGLQ